MDNQLNPLGRNLRRTVERTGMTYREFCHYVGIPEQWLHSIIHQQEEPRWASHMRKVARRTGTPIGELFRM